MEDYNQQVPEWKQKLWNSKYSIGSGKYANGFEVDTHLADIDERLRDLEHKVNPTAKKVLSTRAQQMLILHHLGVLDKLNEFDISKTKKGRLLSILLNADQDNIEKDLSIILNPKSKINSVANYTVVNEAFKQAGITSIMKETDIILDNLLKSENK